VIIIIILAVVFMVGLIVGIVGMVLLGIAHEESDRSLLDEPPTRAAAATRRLVGWYARIPEDTFDVSPLANREDTDCGWRPPVVLSGR
jgi:hypothetical protein